MKRTFIAAVAMMLAAGTAMAAPTSSRIRGTITSVDSNRIVVHTIAGTDVSVALGNDTKYLEVVKSGLDRIEPGSYIGTATKTVGSNVIALEVVVFPPAMKGMGEGHHDWDPLPDTTQSGRSTTSSAMTNGSVTAVASPSGAVVKSAMTNGTVDKASGENGVKKLTVTYNGGQQTVLVPPTAPIVTFRPGTVSDAKKGAVVFIQAVTDGAQTTAGAVLVGTDGVNPPM